MALPASCKLFRRVRHRCLRAAVLGIAAGLLVMTASWLALPPAVQTPEGDAEDGASTLATRTVLERVRVELTQQIQTLEWNESSATNMVLEVPISETSDDSERDRLQEEVEELRSRLNRDTRALQVATSGPIKAGEVEQSARKLAGLQPFLIERARREAELEEVRTQVHLDSPTYRAVLADLQHHESAYRAALESLRPGIEDDLREKRARELRQQIAATAEQLVERLDLLRLSEQLPEKKRPSVRRSQELESMRELRSMIEHEIALIELEPPSKPRSEVREPNARSTRSRMESLLPVFLVSVLVTALCVGFVDRRTDRTGNPSPGAAQAGLSILGTIHGGMHGHEAMNAIGDVLLQRARTAGLQIVMTSCATEYDAAPELARGLAMRLAATGHRTLLIDGHPQAPTLHRHFHLSLAPGWSEALCQEVALSDAIRSSPIKNLSLLPAGEPSDRVASALAQGYPAEALTRQLREQFDLIVLEAGPILSANNALQIGPHADGVILAARSGESQIAQVRSTVEKLAQLQIPILGAVECSDS